MLDDHSHSPECSLRQAEIWILRSRPLTFDVELKVTNPDLILPLLSPLLPSIDRWRSFSLTGKREETISRNNLMVIPKALNHLNITIYDEEFEYDNGRPSKRTFVQSQPERPYIVTMNIGLSRLPSPQLLVPLHFAHITITDSVRSALDSQPKLILDFLSACPQLQSFIYSGFIEDRKVKGHFPIIFLPNLHTLRLKCTCFARSILSSLHAPRLQELYLSHLNVDFRLQQVSPYEDGDSDDDAHDYSQSPWSDHATGMGLRRLLARSNPPLRILEMDFSDMRTKDFRYAFDRMPKLEEFRIVASDMSDTVINFLRPISGFDREPTKFRLPRLRVFKAYNCNRLSGDAVVDAIKTRTECTDGSLRHTLEQVAFVACQGFAPHHEHLLSNILKTRPRAQ